ncbi:MAG: hypothetical protein B7Y45_04030 [Sphingomonas sp. 28-66-16]|nr:MAG: hypothetical protein B7Y45_04030 [Sphingomonas sp. 28-66-16]
MTRLLAIAASFATSVLLLSATAGHAQTSGYYNATPATAPTKTSVITAGTLWKCGDGVCVANKSTQRDPIMCQMVVKRLGTLTAFSVGGTAFDADALAKCNAAAS